MAAASKLLKRTVLYIVFLQFLWLVIMQKFMLLWPIWKYALQGNHIDMSSAAGRSLYTHFVFWSSVFYKWKTECCVVYRRQHHRWDVVMVWYLEFSQLCILRWQSSRMLWCVIWWRDISVSEQAASPVCRVPWYGAFLPYYAQCHPRRL